MRVVRVSHSAVVDAWRDRERELRRRGVDVALLSARSWSEGGRQVPLRPRPGEDVRGARTVGTHPALFLYDPIALWRVLGRSHDLLDVHEEPFALATAEVLAVRAARRAVDRLRGRPSPAPPYLVYSAQNLPKRYPWPFGALERAVLRHAGGAHTCNAGAAVILRDKGLRGPVATIPLGVEPQDPDPRDRRRRPQPGDGEIVVGLAGRLEEHKGVAVLLRALELEPRLRLVVAGGGTLAAAVRTAGHAHGRARLVGALEGEDLGAFYRSVDVLAVPSLTTPGWVEQFGRVAVEAMACGTPVVASASGALPDVVGDAGLLVPPGDARALATALTQVVDEPGLADRMRAAGLETAARCSWSSVAAAYLDLYERVLDPPVPAVDPPEVVVVAYGGTELVRQALDPLVGAYPLTVVDNSSLPGIREIAEQAGALYLDPGRNGGFAAGVNHALAHRRHPGRDVLLLNPDAVVEPDDVARLQRTLHRGPGIASVGPRQVDGDDRPARVVWPYPSPMGAWVEALGLGGLRRVPARRSFVVGSVLLLAAEALDDVGGFDERFFLYAEESDWAYRANRRGWRHVVDPDVEARHLGGASSADATRRDTHFYASQEHFQRKHFGAAGWQVARAGSVLGAAVRTAVTRGDRHETARRRLRLYVGGPAAAERRLRTAGP
ncbi:glycosyltransferase [Isoptericola haloaureus]|uniref:D-inositol 3-phosphate glycosyltransferase n=1 Tax=Isoptericola haloaureus TaxID=1542902 RepID=A0ABU7Z4S2_9MICO